MHAVSLYFPSKLRTHTHRQVPGGRTGLYALACRANHSCAPGPPGLTENPGLVAGRGWCAVGFGGWGDWGLGGRGQHSHRTSQVSWQLMLGSLTRVGQPPDLDERGTLSTLDVQTC